MRQLRDAVDGCFRVLRANHDPLAQHAARASTRELLARRIFFCAGRGETNEGRLVIYALAGLEPRLPGSLRSDVRAAR